MAQPNKSFLIAIFITAFIDMLGIGIIIPIIPVIFYTKEAIHFSHIDTPNQIRWVYCLILASYSFMQFFGAPILGSLSDRYGRKKIIIISLIGSSIGYSLFGIAIKYQLLWLFFFSRLIPGFFGGSLSVLFSAISDISTPQEKPKNFALVGMAFGLGFIFGPMLGGILSDKHIVSWFTLSTPFVLATSLSLSNALFVYFKFNETLQDKKRVPITFFKGVHNIRIALTSINLRILFLISFLSTLGFSFYTQFFSVFMFEKFHISQRYVGFIFGWVGMWLIFTQGFLIRKVNARFKPSQILSITMLLLGCFIIMINFPNYIVGILLCNVFIAISQGLSSPNLLTIVSSQSKPEQQGEILGINQSMQSVAQFIPPIIVGFFGESLATFPFIFGGSCIILAWVFFRFVHLNNRII